MRILLCLLLFCSQLSALSTPASVYSTLDPSSVTQHFAFYELYPQTIEGRNALRHAWELLCGGKSEGDPELILPTIDLQPIVAFVNRSTQEGSVGLDEEQLAVIDKLSKHLGNRKLKGYGIWDVETLLKLKPDEIDLSRGLFLAEMEIDGSSRLKVRSYEANIDLMALQILARLSPEATPLEKVRAINDYIFNEMRFRFPPQSLFAKEIDMYTLLPSVLDSRRGVCLGVSILYLCLAQRLDLNLQAITPPGHIYVRYVDPNGEITNIETTARGIDVPSEHYLGLETRKLQQRSIREVVGLAFVNQAAVCWHKEDSKKAVRLYEQAQKFMGDDYLLNMFLGFNYLFAGQIKEGRKLLEKVKGVIPDHMVAGDTVAEDFLKGNVDVEGIQAIYSEVDDKRASILEKQKKIKTTLTKNPKFRQGHLHLAITWLQLGRYKEALPILERYIRLCPEDPSANYYLSAIYAERLNYNQSWTYLKAAEKLVHAKNHYPKALKDLRQGLQRICPEPK